MAPPQRTFFLHEKININDKTTKRGYPPWMPCFVHSSKPQKAFGFYWSCKISHSGDPRLTFCLVCSYETNNPITTVSINYWIKVIPLKGEDLYYSSSYIFKKSHDATEEATLYLGTDLRVFRKFSVEYHIEIREIKGFKEILMDFGESMRDVSDVQLVAEGREFNVCRKFLARKCSYFKKLFYDEKSDSTKTTYELEAGISADVFQDFLEVLEGESSLINENFEIIILLADYFQSPSVIRKCLQMINTSSIDHAFPLAIKYNLADFVEGQVFKVWQREQFPKNRKDKFEPSSETLQKYGVIRKELLKSLSLQGPDYYNKMIAEIKGFVEKKNPAEISYVNLSA